MLALSTETTRIESSNKRLQPRRDGGVEPEALDVSKNEISILLDGDTFMLGHYRLPFRILAKQHKAFNPVDAAHDIEESEVSSLELQTRAAN